VKHFHSYYLLGQIGVKSRNRVYFYLHIEKQLKRRFIGPITNATHQLRNLTKTHKKSLRRRIKIMYKHAKTELYENV